MWTSQRPAVGSSDWLGCFVFKLSDKSSDHLGAARAEYFALGVWLRWEFLWQLCATLANRFQARVFKSSRRSEVIKSVRVATIEDLLKLDANLLRRYLVAMRMQPTVDVGSETANRQNATYDYRNDEDRLHVA
jgi:hypothetical protein